MHAFAHCIGKRYRELRAQRSLKPKRIDDRLQASRFPGSVVGLDYIQARAKWDVGTKHTRGCNGPKPKMSNSYHAAFRPSARRRAAAASEMLLANSEISGFSKTRASSIFSIDR